MSQTGDGESACAEIAKDLGIPFSGAATFTRTPAGRWRQLEQETVVVIQLGKARSEITMAGLLSQKAFAACVMEACSIIPKQLPQKRWLEVAQCILNTVVRSEK